MMHVNWLKKHINPQRLQQKVPSIINPRRRVKPKTPSVVIFICIQGAPPSCRSHRVREKIAIRFG